MTKIMVVAFMWFMICLIASPIIITVFIALYYVCVSIGNHVFESGRIDIIHGFNWWWDRMTDDTKEIWSVKLFDGSLYPLSFITGFGGFIVSIAYQIAGKILRKTK